MSLDEALKKHEGKTFHFLVVDDDPESRGTVVEYLKSMGHKRITECADGAAAVSALEHDSSISFIISDWDMPMMNGLSLLQWVKSNPTRANLPFLIMTSPISQESEKVMMAAENLVDGYLIKPFRLQILQDKIEKILEVTIRGPQKQVLVVDDDADSREMVIEYLAQMGFKDILGLADGRAAMNYLLKNPTKIGLVVSDWEMPEMNGIELLRGCKSDSALDNIPFLMITSQSSIESMKVIQAGKANVDQYLLKPFSLGDIRKRIEVLVEKARTRTEVQDLLAEALDHLEHNRHFRAQLKFEKSLKLDPNNDTALRHLGELTMKTKSLDAALPFFKRAVECNPYNAKGYLKLAAAYEQLGWVDKSIALLQAAKLQISFSAELHFHLGKLYNKRDMIDEAKTEFEKTLEIQLDHQEARLMLEILSKGKIK